MKVLGINISHDASISEVVDGKVVSYYKEERFRRIKTCWSPSECFLKHTNDIACIKYKCIDEMVDLSTVDKVVIASHDMRGQGRARQTNREEQIIIKELKKQVGNIPTIYEVNHHLYHAFCGTYFSNFNDAICIIMDGGGAKLYPSHKELGELESVYTYENGVFTRKFVRMGPLEDIVNYETSPEDYQREIDDVSSGVEIDFDEHYRSGAQKFADLSVGLGFLGGQGSGKVMGLAAYAQNDRQWADKTLAKKLQEETFLQSVELIKKAISYSTSKNIVLSGGYALNCTNNYRYTQEFPEYNFFVDPCAYDGGTAMGAALWGYYDNK